MKRDEDNHIVMTFSPDLIGSVLFIALSSFFLLKMDSEVYVSNPEGVNARTFPFIVLSIILIISLFMFFKEIFLIALKKERHKVRIVLSQEIRTLMVFSLMLVYAFLIPILGFMLSSVLFSISFSFLLGARRIRYFVIVSALSVFIGVLFIYVLKVRF